MYGRVSQRCLVYHFIFNLVLESLAWLIKQPSVIRTSETEPILLWYVNYLKGFINDYEKYLILRRLYDDKLIVLARLQTEASLLFFQLVRNLLCCIRAFSMPGRVFSH